MNITSVLIVMLLIWFSFDITGLRIGKVIFAESCLKDEPLDVIWWVIFLGSVVLRFISHSIGFYVMMIVVLALWLTIQYYFTFRYIIFPESNKIQGYNKFFLNTHHVIEPSEKILVPDTYHIVLFGLIIMSFIATIIEVILKYLA